MGRLPSSARILAVAVTLSMVLAPATGLAQSSSGSQGEAEPITFYGHVFGVGMGEEAIGGPQPANTEAPIGEAIFGSGIYHWCTPAATASNLDLGETDDTCRTDEENVLALYSTPGTVDVSTVAEFEQGGGHAQLHNERGQTKDIRLGDGSVTSQVFLTVDRHGWPTGGQPYGTDCVYAHPPNVPCVYPYWGWDVGTQPAFTVQATLYAADLGSRTNSSAAPPVGGAIASGDAEVIAQGSTTKDLPVNGMPSTPKVLQYAIDMGPPQVDTIDRSKDFFTTYRFYSETSGQAWGLASWRIWSGEFFPPTFTMPVENPLTVERVIPTFVHGKLAVLGVVNTPWGSYDVQEGTVDLAVEGPDGSQVEPSKLSTSGLSRSLAHGGHYVPVNKTWIWDYQRESGLEPGNYTVTVSADNLQGSVSDACQASFTLRETANGLAPGEATPGRCGQQTLTEEQADQLERKANATS